MFRKILYGLSELSILGGAIGGGTGFAIGFSDVLYYSKPERISLMLLTKTYGGGLLGMGIGSILGCSWFISGPIIYHYGGFQKIHQKFMKSICEKGD